MEVDCAVQAVIAAPVDVVAEYAADPTNAPHWYANIESVHWQTPPPVRVGSLLDFQAKFLGRHLSYTYEVVESIPGRRFVMRTADGPFPMETTYEWEATSAGTLMRLRNRGAPRGFAALARPVLQAAMRRAMTKDLKQLGKQLAG